MRLTIEVHLEREDGNHGARFVTELEDPRLIEEQNVQSIVIAGMATALAAEVGAAIVHLVTHDDEEPEPVRGEIGFRHSDLN